MLLTFRWAKSNDRSGPRRTIELISRLSIGNPVDMLSHDVFLNKSSATFIFINAEATLGACPELPYVSASSPEPSSRRTICRQLRTKSSPVLQGRSRLSPASPADRPPISSSRRPRRRTLHAGASSYRGRPDTAASTSCRPLLPAPAAAVLYGPARM